MKETLHKSLATVIISIALLTVAAAPGAAANKVIGVIMTDDIQFYSDVHKAFITTLAKDKEVIGNVEVLVQMPAPNTMSRINAARKLVAIGSDVIVTYGAPVTLATMNEVNSIPLVFAGVSHPKELGVKAINSTGISSTIPVAGVLKNLKSIYAFTKLGVVYNPAEKDTVYQAEEIKRLEEQFSFKTTVFSIKRLGDASKIKGVDALFITSSCSAFQCIDDVLGVVREQKLPTATTIGGGQEKGIILTVTAVPEEQGRRAAELVAKIIKGGKVTDMPVESPKKIVMIINLKEATALGLKIPFDLLTSASIIIK